VDRRSELAGQVHLRAQEIPVGVLQRISIAGIELTVPSKGGRPSVWEPNVIPHELRRLFGTETFVWGGDFNTDPRMDDFDGFAGGTDACLRSIAGRALVTPESRFYGDCQQLFFRATNRAGWQLDHVFADEATEAKVRAWSVGTTPATGDDPYSDHAPIIIDIGV
jgi:hypothetical protein